MLRTVREKDNLEFSVGNPHELLVPKSDKLTKLSLWTSNLQLFSFALKKNAEKIEKEDIKPFMDIIELMDRLIEFKLELDEKTINQLNKMDLVKLK